ncbi:MAG: hypothetical protein ACFFD2_17810 [Promethearchaeota archaeon]
MGDLISVRNEIRDNWVDNRVDDGITQAIARTEEIAKENGFTQSIRKQSMKYILPLMIGLFALSFIVIFWIGEVLPAEYYWVTYVIYTGILLSICIIPRIIQHRLLERWRVFGEEQGPKIKKYISGITERIQKFIQFLIDDVREILDNSNLDLANYHLMLFGTNYKNIKIIREEVRKNLKFYIVELLPFVTDVESAPISEESYDDEFESYET